MQSNSSDNSAYGYDIMILNLFDLELQRIHVKPRIKNRFRKLLSEMKMFKVKAVLILEYKKTNDHKTFHSCTKPIASNSDIYEAFKSMHQSIVKKIKHWTEDWTVLDVITIHNITLFDCYSREYKQ